MSEQEAKARIKIVMISMGLRPTRKGFAPLSEAIAESAMKELPMKEIYEKLSKKRNQSKSSLERSMRLCLTDIDGKSFAKGFNELTGFNIVTDSMRFSYNSFVGLMSELVSIAFRSDDNDKFKDSCRNGFTVD